MRPGRAADHSPPSSAAVMEEYSYTSTHPLGHTGPVTGSLYLYLFSNISEALIYTTKVLISNLFTYLLTYLFIYLASPLVSYLGS